MNNHLAKDLLHIVSQYSIRNEYQIEFPHHPSLCILLGMLSINFKIVNVWTGMFHRENIVVENSSLWSVREFLMDVLNDND